MADVLGGVRRLQPGRVLLRHLPLLVPLLLRLQVSLPVVVHGSDVVERLPVHLRQSGSARLPPPRGHGGQHGERPQREGHERRREPHQRSSVQSAEEQSSGVSGGAGRSARGEQLTEFIGR